MTDSTTTRAATEAHAHAHDEHDDCGCGHDHHHDHHHHHHHGSAATYQRAAPKVGRNDACPCGSGRKYKKCCLAHEQA